MPRPLALLLALLLVPLLVPLLAGCGDPAAPPPTPEPTATPAFASDEEALAAAVEAYTAYLAVSDAALSTYDRSALESVATGQALTEAINSVNDFQAKDQRLVGTTALDLPRLIFSGSEEIGIYGCLDLTGTDVVSRDGLSVLPGDRPTRYPMEIYLSYEPTTRGWLVNTDEVWSGQNFCG